MTDPGRARDVNEAARRFAETVADSYRLVYAQAAESGERQRRLTQEFSELVATKPEGADRGEPHRRRTTLRAGRKAAGGRAGARPGVCRRLRGVP
jgi:hypothetical protein